ncbi:MAG: serine/threonine-protein kinase [Myxococcota bacterium]
MKDAPPGFEVHEKAGEGGMGVVYRANFEGRIVALKLLRPDLLPAGSAALRFSREVRAARALAHPSIAFFVAEGQTPAGRPFVAHEWIEGTTLAEHGPCSSRRAVELMEPILDALGHAHQTGLVHRDVTPRNLIITDAGAKLIDFGLVASLARSVDEQTWSRLTKTGFVVGTPPYMAPEQIEGRKVSAATDLWAMGVILYWLSSGREPFLAKTPTLRMLKAVSEPPRPLNEVAPHLSADFCALVTRAMEKEPAQRWPSAQAMRDALLTAKVGDVCPEASETTLATTRTRRR